MNHEITPLTCASIAWDLPHAQVMPVEPTEPQRLHETDVVFLAVDRVSDLWIRAVGEPTRSFRSTQLEREAWQALTALNRQLHRVVDRGGLIVCRLDLPSSRCQVRDVPDDPWFPGSFELNAYQAVARVDPALATLAAHVGQLATPEFQLAPTAHPLGDYLAEFAGEFLPQVAVAPHPPGAERLAHSAAGYSVALAWEQVYCVPPAPETDPRREAAALLGVVRQARETPFAPKLAALDRSPELMSDLSLPGIDALRQLERDLSAQIRQLESRRDLVRRRRVAREELWRLLPVSDGPRFKAAVAKALEVLGFPPAASETHSGVWLSGEVETLPSLLGTDSGFLLRGRLRLDSRMQRKVTFYSPGPAVGKASDAVAPSRLFADRSRRQGEALVPIGELLEAASVVLMSPHDEPVVARVRKTLVDCLGLYRFDLGQLIDPAEKDVLLRPA